ncbi:MAG TPA: hypothetical protein PLD25_15635 [Chloroflexota bacterium]|nr:hypothetical protein [Chloroflexota bacterium]
MSRRRRRLPYSSSGRRPFWQRVSTAGWLLLGLVIGLSAGLYYSWVVDPVVYINAGPSRLSEAHKAEYIFLVSQSYAADGNWGQAQQRLAALEDPNLAETVNALLESYVRNLASPEALRHLAALAQQLGAEGGAVGIFAPTAAALPTPTLASQVFLPTPEPLPTLTAVPAQTPTATLPPQPTEVFMYQLLNQERLCDQEGTPRIEVITQDASLNDLPGTAVRVRWAGGEDRFFTGFKPDLGAGYGDFTMTPDVSYAVALLEGSPEVSGLRMERCADGREGGWRLVFQKLADTPGRDN